MPQIIIGDDNYLEHRAPLVIDDDVKGFGLVQRDVERHPVGSLPGVRKFDGALIPWEEFPERIAEMHAKGILLSKIRRRMGPNGGHIPSLDQGNSNFCWNYSATGALMLARVRAGQPYIRLSGHANAWMIKNGRNEGGWSPQAAERLVSHGCPDVEHWPEKSMNGRVHNNADTWVNAAQHKLVEGWADLNLSIYDRNLTAQQVLTCLCQLNPCTMDRYWWSHSTFAMDPLDVYKNRRFNDPTRYGTLDLNSWSDRYGDLGEFVVKDSKWIPDGGVAILTASVAAGEI